MHISTIRKKQLEDLFIETGIQSNENILLLMNAALTHPSFVFEKGSSAGPHNQRLEFLGDAVVGLIVGDYLYTTYPEKSEGELTKMRAAVVCEGSLARAAEILNLGSYLLMGKGEKLGGGAKRPSNLADAFESLVGALYLGFGLEIVKKIILKYIKPEINKVVAGDYGDYKTQLQELIQKNPGAYVEYKIIAETGPDHDKQFLAGVYLNQNLMAQGKGKTKKEAEQHAAHSALIILGALKK